MAGYSPCTISRH